MTAVPLGRTAYDRKVAQQPKIEMLNRVFEQNPTNLVDGVSLLARPGTKHFRNFGSGILRGYFTQPGTFGGDLFVVSGTQLSRWDGTAEQLIGGVVSEAGQVDMTIVAGAGYEHLFVADGVSLQFYDGENEASSTLTSTGAIANSDEVKIDTVHYRWTSGDVDAGTPLGTAGDPFLVDLGVDAEDSLLNLFRAINATGVGGTDYSTIITTAHTTVRAVQSTATLLDIEAILRGVGGNTIATTVETGVNIAWDAATLEGGGTHTLQGVPTPDDIGIVSLATIASHVIAVQAQSQRFFWIIPAATTIAPLNFAEAENEPDQVHRVRIVGDQVWFFGESSVETWYVTQNVDIRFAPTQGIAFSRGVVQSTPVRVKDRLLFVADDNMVYEVGGGGIRRISNHALEERIRLTLKAEREAA